MSSLCERSNIISLIFLTLTDVEELGGYRIGMTSSDQRYIRMHEGGLFAIELPKAAVSFVDTVINPDHGVAEFVQQRISRSFRRVQNLFGEFNLAFTRDFLDTQRGGGRSVVATCLGVFAISGCFEKPLVPSDGHVARKFHIEDSLVVI